MVTHSLADDAPPHDVSSALFFSSPSISTIAKTTQSTFLKAFLLPLNEKKNF
jgi:hypothetical protein